MELSLNNVQQGLSLSAAAGSVDKIIVSILFHSSQDVRIRREPLSRSADIMAALSRNIVSTKTRHWPFSMALFIRPIPSNHPRPISAAFGSSSTTFFCPTHPLEHRSIQGLNSDLGATKPSSAAYFHFVPGPREYQHDDWNGC